MLTKMTPIHRLLTENWESSVKILDHWLERLEPLEDNAAFNFVNSLENLLWAFELRATASLLFQLAVKRRIYQNHVFRYKQYYFVMVICYYMVLRSQDFRR